MLWATSASGFFDGALWLEALQKLKEVYADFAPGVTPLVLTDNASIHRLDSALEWCVANRVHGLLLAARRDAVPEPLSTIWWCSPSSNVSSEVRLLERQRTSRTCT